MGKTEPQAETNKKENVDTKGCPKCQFNGKDSDVKKFSIEQMNRFPKGYSTEKHPKIIVKNVSGQQIQEFAYDENNKMIYNNVKRCPVCGHESEDIL